MALTTAALAVTSPAASQDARTLPLTATATRASRPPAIDGKGDDAVWHSAPKFGGFRQFEPKADAEPSFKTEFQVAYDDGNVYVFVRMFDPHPDSILHALSRRDQRGPSDQVKVLIDSYGDRRTGYQFAVNPDGVQRDFSISNDTQEDGSWNGVWDVGTQVDEQGWTAEFRIPLSQLRYSPSQQTVFGFGVWRDIERYRERSAWPAYVPTRNGLASQLGRLEGLAGITTARRVELTPYVVTRNVERTLPQSRFERDQQLTGGADLKLGLTPNITLDATVNPDFGQVESDPADLKRTAFEIRVEERRPF
ncbi:MAG: carbohydrate binding family 9 domain-containing protein, partial [Cytophagaceae bacterium]|nr:carbohydrate binding family 9 domain-containing protein [Gemmatimonadaceae bacterium]